jgi:hypothetical protein
MYALDRLIWALEERIRNDVGESEEISTQGRNNYVGRYGAQTEMEMTKEDFGWENIDGVKSTKSVESTLHAY